MLIIILVVYKIIVLSYKNKIVSSYYEVILFETKLLTFVKIFDERIKVGQNNGNQKYMQFNWET